MRRRPDSLSLVAQTWFGRRTEPHDCPLFVRRSRRADAYRIKQRISAGQLPLRDEEYASRGRGMFSDLSDQISPVAVRFTFPARGRGTSSPPQFGQIEFSEAEHSPQNVHS